MLSHYTAFVLLLALRWSNLHAPRCTAHPYFKGLHLTPETKSWSLYGWFDYNCLRLVSSHNQSKIRLKFGPTGHSLYLVDWWKSKSALLVKERWSMGSVEMAQAFHKRLNQVMKLLIAVQWLWYFLGRALFFSIIQWTVTYWPWVLLMNQKTRWSYQNAWKLNFCH